MLVEYAGPELRSGDRVTWQVKVWTDLGESDWSAPGVFELGLLEAGDWIARWVVPVEVGVPPAGSRPATLVRGEFELPSGAAVVRARLYATAHGIYEVFVNGRRVGDAELTPGYTEYRDRLQVQTFEINEALVPGRNAIGAIVSDGWFRGQVGLPRAHDQWGSELGFLAQVCATFDGGATAVAGTGPGWRSTRSWIVSADLIAGQSVDLRRVPSGWSEPGFDDSGWDPVSAADYGYDNLVASPAPPVRVVEELSPVSVRDARGGQVFDLGQNINGWVHLRSLGPEGTSLTLTHGEAIDASDDVTTSHLDVDLPFLPEPLPAGQVDRVVSAGRPGETFQPRHTTHGFQYARVEGHPNRLDARRRHRRGRPHGPDAARAGSAAATSGSTGCTTSPSGRSATTPARSRPTARSASGPAGPATGSSSYPPAAFLYDVAGLLAQVVARRAAEQLDDGRVTNYAPDALRQRSAERGPGRSRCKGRPAGATRS